ncbi:MAG: TolC family protein [Eubacteriales bacterium]|nr:TolC family protein [Eubacteriales bacterium]
MKIWKPALSLGLAGALTAAYAFGAYAASPEFARTPEEWARLRDNVMEYDELEDLIAEYNVTVQTNQLDYNEFKREYGTTKDDVSQKYRDMADEIYASLEYPDTDDPTYGMMVASVLNAELQAKNMEKQADDNLQDSEIVWLGYRQAEKTLVTVAQTNMVTYEKDRLAVSQAELAAAQARLSLSSAQTREAIGTATRTDVLNAQEAVQNADRAVESAKSSVKTVRQKLQVMTGWSYSDSPEIRDVPASDLSRIDGMNPAADREKAIENNYALKINKKKLANAEASETKESLQKTIADNEQKIGSALVTSYQNVLAAKLAYDQAAADLELENRNLASLQLQYAQGNASRSQLENQQYTVQAKELALKAADLSLFQTMETYDWAVNGLAAVS